MSRRPHGTAYSQTHRLTSTKANSHTDRQTKGHLPKYLVPVAVTRPAGAAVPPLLAFLRRRVVVGVVPAAVLASRSVSTAADRVFSALSRDAAVSAGRLPAVLRAFAADLPHPAVPGLLVVPTSLPSRRARAAQPRAIWARGPWLPPPLLSSAQRASAARRSARASVCAASADSAFAGRAVTGTRGT